MRLYRHLGLFVLAMGISSPAFAELRPDLMTDIDGRLVANPTVRRRPWVVSDNGGTLDLSNIRVHDVTNQKAFFVSLSSPDLTPTGQQPWTYSKVYLHNIEAGNINRDETTAPGLHMDFLLMDGQGLRSPRETEVVIEDAYFHDGDALTTLIKAARYSQITFRRVKVENTTTPVQLGVVGDGYIKNVLVEDSPGLQVAMMGVPGSIGTAIIRNSAGANVVDTTNYLGTRSNARIIYDNLGTATFPQWTPDIAAISAAVPEPASAALIGLAGVLMLKRRRR